MTSNSVKVAAVQMEPRILDKAANLKKCLKLLEQAAKNGARLIVFPECALTGYVFGSLDEAVPVFESLPGPGTDALAEACKRLGVYLVIGILEIDAGKHYNSAVLIGPDGLAGKKYRKTHLPYLGIDRYLDRGEAPPEVYDTPAGRIGMGICYDTMFPEHARVLALKGADIFVLPTNWPEEREHIPEHIIPARAAENRVFVIAADRVGVEGGARFIGTSVIADCAKGRILARGSADKEEIIYAEIVPARAREKHAVIGPGEFEFDVVKDRRPELYKLLIQTGEP